MNSKKILSMLLVSLGAFTLGLSGCKNNDNSNSTSDTTTSNTDKPSETTSSTDTSSENTSSSDVVEPEAKTWEVAFNVDVPKEELTVWTDFAIDKSIGVELGDATTKANMTGKDLTGRTTVPLDSDPGMYYFAVDADGYLVYAGYGLGAGYGSPSDGYYHNQDAADPYSMSFWALHDSFETWPTWYSGGQKKVDVNGVKQYTFSLFNFVIPEDGFVVKGFLNEQSLRELFKELVGDSPLTEVGHGCAGAFDKQYNSQWGKTTVEPKALDKYYFYINDNHELALRERTAEELKDEGGEQLKDTPSHCALTADDELEKFASIGDVVALKDGDNVNNAKGVITYIDGTVAYVQDEKGNTVRVTSEDIKNANVGDTIAFNGTLSTFKGQPQVEATNVKTITGYGTVSAIATKNITNDNVADFVGLKNNLKKIKVIKAEVKETNKVTIGDVEFTVDVELTVGDTVDFTGFYTFEDGKNVIHSVEDVAKYAKVIVNVGDTIETKSAAKGEVVEFSPEKADSAYTFVKWQVKNENGEWEDVTTERDLKVTVGEGDVEYQAVFEYAPWAKLPKYYTDGGKVEVQSTSKDSPLSVWTSDDFALSGDWAKGSINASWRTIVAVDAEGKVAYAVFCPANGYGGPSGTGYYAHSDYADYTTNPAIRILDGYGPWSQEDPSASKKFEIIVPKGGFLITSYNDDNNNLLCANTIVNMVTKGAMTAADNNFNKKNPAYDDVRIFFDKTNNEVKAFKSSLAEGEQIISLSSEGIYQTGKLILDPNDLQGQSTSTLDWRWKFVVIADKDGKIAYGNAYYANGWVYGGTPTPDSRTYFADPMYLTEDAWKTNPAFEFVTPGDASQFKIVVPEGGVGFVYGGGTADANKLISLLTNNRVKEVGDATQGDINTKALLGEGVRLTYKNDMLIFKAGENPVETSINVMTGTDEIKVDGTGYTIAVDKDGKVIYASWGLTAGYGGPSDGFYHDGTYKCEAGKVCGIFNLSSEFAPWPAKTADGKDAWTQYTFVMPEGGMIISDTKSKLANFIKELTGKDVNNYTDNKLFETDVVNGSLNDLTVKYVDGNLVVEKKTVETETKVENLTATVMTGTDEINVDGTGYTIAVDKNGKIIYASWGCGAGYGGPADGFYHDGNYVLKTGEVCGMFNIYSTFAGWPAKTPDGKNAWSEYNVVIPEGGMIISGTNEQMADLIMKLTGKDVNNYTDNKLFETEIADGTLNNKTLSYDATTKTLTIVSVD